MFLLRDDYSKFWLDIFEKIKIKWSEVFLKWYLMLLEIWTRCFLGKLIGRSKIFLKNTHQGGIISMIRHDLCIFCIFSTFARNILKGSDWHEALVRCCASNQWWWSLWHASLSIIYAYCMGFSLFHLFLKNLTNQAEILHKQKLW